MKVWLLVLTLLAAPLSFTVAQPNGIPTSSEVITTGPVSVVTGDDLQNAVVDAIEQATTELSGGAGLGDLARSPALLTLLFTLLGAAVTYFTVNGIKLSTSIKGRSTQLLAMLTAAVSGGVGGYFGLAEAAGMSGINGAALGVLSALGSFLIARGKHEQNRYEQTGLRKPERKALGKAGGPLVDLTVMGLQTLAAGFGLNPIVVNGLLKSETLERAWEIIENMGAERPLTLDEMIQKSREYRSKNALPPLTPEEEAQLKTRAEQRRAQRVVAVKGVR